ncbi:MAG: hypothetical protein J7L19_00160 [Dehalococcoidia bacterium]|nr:hypothetical protein [Dehalococcoidia bacterium]
MQKKQVPVIRFKVDGYPPKKDSGVSMWGTKKAAKRLVRLRRKALEIRPDGWLDTWAGAYLSVDITMYITQTELKASNEGDIDNLIGGVLDGLQSARHSRTKIHEIFSKPENKDICPDNVILIHDDRTVLSVTGGRKLVENDQQVYYEVVVKPITVP